MRVLIFKFAIKIAVEQFIKTVYIYFVFKMCLKLERITEEM